MIEIEEKGNERELIEDKLSSAAEKILPDYDIEVAYLYGSFARGDFSDKSDVDVAVYFRDYKLKKLLEVGRRLKEESGIGRELDVRALNKGTSRFKFEVIQKGKVIYEIDSSKRADIETKIVRTYHDQEPYVKEHRKTRKKVMVDG